MTRLSMRAKLTISYAAALLVVLSVFGAYVLWQQGRVAMRRVDGDLEAFADTLANLVQEELAELGDAREAAEEASGIMATSGRALAILDARGDVLAASWAGLTPPNPLPTADSGPRVRTVETATVRGVFTRSGRPLARPPSFSWWPVRSPTCAGNSVKRWRRC
jgi:hypothetical protein